MNHTVRILLLPFLLVLSFWLNQELIYEPFIVPQLSAWKEIPIMWWVAVFAPEVIVCALAAWSFRKFTDSFIFCVLGGLSVTGYQFLSGLLNEPGHHKIIEGGFVHFGLQLFIITMLLALAVGVLVLIRAGINRVRAG